MNVIDKKYIESRYHLGWGEGWIRSCRYGLPILNRETFVPNRIVPFDKIDKTKDKSGCVIFNSWTSMLVILSIMEVKPDMCMSMILPEEPTGIRIVRLVVTYLRPKC